MVIVERIQRSPWNEFRSAWAWEQGEHVTLLGPTGAGKTTLALDILDRRSYVLVLATKPKDATFSRLRRQGFDVIREWPPPALSQKMVLWPPIREVKHVPAQRMVFAAALKDVYRQGGWTLYLDEARYVTDTLKLAPLVELLWLQGRSMGVTLVASSQRPRAIPVAAFSEASHFFFWKSRDLYDVRRLREIGGYVDADLIVQTLAGLERHECLAIDARYGTLTVTQVAKGGS